MSIKTNISALFHPERFHGWGKTSSYFEGWYYKVVSADESHAFAFIPGIAMDKNGESHAFVQVLDGIHKTASYHKFDAAHFIADPSRFHVSIEKNYFTETSLQVNLSDISADLTFRDRAPWPKKWYSPGIMGPFSFVPFMQCYHAILSMDHIIEGSIIYKGKEIDMTGGRGYMEKDWGRSFPSAYTWMQSNHFSEPGFSFKSSVAKIPWLGSSFVGFIAGLWLKDRLIKFTTYNLTQLKESYADQDIVKIRMQNPKYELIINAERSEATSLASPIQGFMDGRIEESMTATLHVKVIERKSGQIIFEDTGRMAGLEVAGKIEEITI